jgi:hypothetical protein
VQNNGFGILGLGIAKSPLLGRTLRETFVISYSLFRSDLGLFIAGDANNFCGYGIFYNNNTTQILLNLM